MKSSIVNIQTNRTQVFSNINGEIKKIFIHSSEPKHHISLTFKTNEGEVIYEVKLSQPITVIYPLNFISDQAKTIPYYSFGDLFMEINGLQEDEEIEQVSIFYN